MLSVNCIKYAISNSADLTQPSGIVKSSQATFTDCIKAALFCSASDKQNQTKDEVIFKTKKHPLLTTPTSHYPSRFPGFGFKVFFYIYICNFYIHIAKALLYSSKTVPN